jgi:DNA primase
MKRDNLDFLEACRALGAGDLRRPARAARAQAPSPTVTPEPPPSPTWQAAAEAFVLESEQALWAPTAERARAWLHRRGLTDDALEGWRIGYCAANHYGEAADWDTEHKVWLPRGIVIPWTQDGQTWAIKVRLPANPPDKKYHAMTGSKMDILYGNATVQSHKPLVMLESELDVVLLDQDAGDLVSAGTLNGKRTDFTLRMLYVLRKAHPIFIGYDNDAPGQKAARQIIEQGPRFRPVRWPDGVKDLADMQPAGYSVRFWVEHHLAQVQQIPLEAEDEHEHSDQADDVVTVNVDDETVNDDYAQIPW